VPRYFVYDGFNDHPVGWVVLGPGTIVLEAAGPTADDAEAHLARLRSAVRWGGLPAGPGPWRAALELTVVPDEGRCPAALVERYAGPVRERADVPHGVVTPQGRRNGRGDFRGRFSRP
jgi:hypothetical protein